MAKQDKPKTKSSFSKGITNFGPPKEKARIPEPFKKGDKQKIPLGEKNNKGKYLSSKELAAKGDSLIKESLRLKKDAESKWIGSVQQNYYLRKSEWNSNRAAGYYKAAELRNKKK